MLKNPFAKSEHIVFNKTFLTKVRLKVDFGMSKVFDKEYWERFQLFANEEFGGMPQMNPSENEVLKVQAENIDLAFEFWPHRVVFEIGGNFYRSFESSLKKPIETIQRYLVEVLKIKSSPVKIRLEKYNEWHLELDKPLNSESINKCIFAVFQPRYADKLRFAGSEESHKNEISFPLGDNNTLTLILESSIRKQSEVECKMKSVVELNDLETKSMFDEVKEANDILFDCYIDTITDGIISFQKS